MTSNKAKFTLDAIEMAKQIISVQPMTGPTGQIFKLTAPTKNRPYSAPRPSYQIITSEKFIPPHDHCVVSVNSDIADWIEQQPIHMWKPAECLEAGWTGYEYVISNKLYSWLTLRWSS
jgi:hypothetical protein